MANTTEKRIVEIVIKAVGDADLKRLGRELGAMRKEAQASRREIEKTNQTLSGFGNTFKTVAKAFGGGLALKNLVQSSEIVQELTQNVRDLAGEFLDAAADASGLTDTIGNPEFWAIAKQGAKDLGEAIGGIAKSIRELGQGGDGDGAVAGALRSTLNTIIPGQSVLESIAKTTWAAYKERVKFDLMPIASADWTELMGDLDRAVASGMERAISTDKTQDELSTILRNRRELFLDALKEQREFAEAMAFKPTRYDYGHGELAAQMDAAARSVNLVRIDIERVGEDLGRMVEDSQTFQETWSWLERTTLSWSDALENAIADMQSMFELQSDLTTQAMAWGDALTRGVAGVLNRELHNTRDLLRTITDEMRNFYAELAARAAAQEVFGWISSAIGLFGSGYNAGNPMAPQAKGNAFARGNVTPFANGGIVTRPTIFPMARGMGLMGEAGPEAVMPLRRGRDGKLGVSAARSNVVIENHGAPVSATIAEDDAEMRIVLRAANMGANLAQDRINRSVRSGYGPTAQTMQASWGLRRRV